MKRLNEIINCNYNIPIKGIKTDSRNIEEGDLFIAIKGFNEDHHEYIDDAIKNGAIAIIGEKDIDCSVPYIKIKNTNEELPKILSKYYDKIEDDFNFIGITGTDGKTTTATIISKILNCCYIGTNGVIYKNVKINSNNTTPEICELYEYLVKLKRLGCKTIVIEVSSEALLHKRVDNIKFNFACLTNITEDHLNIHKTIENYIKSKKKLFSLVNKNGISILNVDDKNYKNVKESCKYKIYTYGKEKIADFKICQINTIDYKMRFKIKHQDIEYEIITPLYGEYNAYNITLAFCVCYSLGMIPQEIIKAINDITEVEGRGERLDFGQNYTIILDYAHTYNGIYNIITNVKKLNPKRILVLTGAAGGREKEKRSKIGKMILENSTYTIFTMDDPRYEDVNNIIDDLVSKSNLTNYEKVIDRKEAISKIFSIAEEGDIVLILGKGRDNYMAIENKKVKYCDYDVINKYFKDKNVKK